MGKNIRSSGIEIIGDTPWGARLCQFELKESYDHLEELVQERTVQLEKAYKRLKESEIDLSEAQKMAHIGSWKWDIVTGELYWSDELYLIFGLDPQEFRPAYNSFFNYIHPGDRDFVDNAIKKALNGEQLYDNDHRIISADGEERIVHSHGEVIFDEKNTPVRMRGHSRTLRSVLRSKTRFY